MAQYVSNYTFWDSPRHCSTAYEGACRGEAAWMIAYGQYLESRSRAIHEIEAAKRDALMNRPVYLSAIREFQSNPTNGERDPVRGSSNLAQAAKLPAPTLPPAPSCIDEIGKISWPVALRGPSYDQPWRELDTLFTTGFYPGGMAFSGAARQYAERIVKNLSAELLRHIEELPTMEYIEAKRSINQLSDKLRKSSNAPALAMASGTET